MRAEALFSPETVYIAKSGDQQEILSTVSADLLERGLIKEGFLENLLAHEAEYPTGMNMQLIDTSAKNFAVPHTETEFVNTTRIVPIKLEHPIEWHDMLNPPETFEVSFLFMILNASKEAQTGLLARIMDFANAKGVVGLDEFFALNSTEDIYNELAESF